MIGLTALMAASVLQAGAPGRPSAQEAPPTVGDTVWLRRSVQLPPGHVIRPADWQPSDPVEVLDGARLTTSGDRAEIAYPVVFWRPGRHRVEIPGPLLLGPAGRVDSLAGEQIQVEIASVLPPAATRGSLPPPQPRAALVDRPTQSVVPLLALWTLGILIVVPLHLWWRRRGQPSYPGEPHLPSPEPPLERWAEAGEYRAVANLAAMELRAAVSRWVPLIHPGLDTGHLLTELSRSRPDWPIPELEDLLRGLDGARFGTASSPDALELSRAGLEMRDRLLGEAA